MKNFKVLFAAFFAILLITSCSENMMDPIESESFLKGKSISNVIEWPADISCISNYTLVGGQTIPMGSVIVGESGDDIYIKYVADEEYLLIEAHTYVGDVEIILDKKGSPKIGHFPYATENMDGLEEIIFKISKDAISVNAEGDPYAEGDCFEIAAHAVVVCAENGSPAYEFDADGSISGYTCEETAWAQMSGKNFCSIKARMDSENGGAITVGATENSYEGIIFNIQDITGGTIPMVELANYVTEAGLVSVELDEGILRFTVTSHFGLVYWSRLFIGDQADLDKINIWDSHSFPYKVYSEKDENGIYIGDEEQIFEFPSSILTGGEDLSFPGSRWGYYINYCPC